MFYFVNLLVLLCVAWGTPRSAQTPFSLNLLRVERSPEKGADAYRVAYGKEARSRSLLFEKVLGIYPGAPFAFDMAKWRLLQSCGLFSNLTARTVMRKNGDVVTVISGGELPSIQFAPEVALGAKSIEKPELSGNLMFRDNNFRGLGERIELLVRTFQRGIDSKTSGLPPTIRFKWYDGIRGRPSSVTMSVEEDHSLEDPSNIMSVRQSGTNRGQNSKRLVLAVSRMSVVFHGLFHNKPTTTASSSYSSFNYELEPYNTRATVTSDDQMTALKSIFHLSGAKLKLTALLNEGGAGTWRCGLSSAELVADCGLLKQMDNADPGALSAPSSAPYRHASISLTSREFPLRRFRLGQDNLFDLNGQLKVRGLQAWGRGCVPLYHHTVIEDPLYLRGFADKALLPRVPEIAVLKADAYLLGWLHGIPGVFLDAGVFTGLLNPVDRKETKWWGRPGSFSSSNLAFAQELRKVTTLGVSFRSHGFRFEMGWPCLSPRTLPRLYLTIDS